MTQKNIQWLVAIVVGLVLLMFVLKTTDDTGPSAGERPLLPGFAAAANAIDTIRVTGGAEDGDVVITRAQGRWSVSSRDGYAADIGVLRQLTLALAEATIVEEKTANPENYARLGVDDPEQGGSGIRLSLSGDGTEYTVILGDTAQGDYRYARVAGDATSYLIDRNPDLPASAGDWLASDIVDLPSERIRRVTITHADGETISIEKDSEDQADFGVLDIPEGRELSYASIGNGIGGTLANLELDDVRQATAADDVTRVVFETWDDTRITVEVALEEDTSWVAFAADPDIDGLNARVSGWQYKLPEFKKNLLTRRWTDLLKAEDTGTDE